MINVDDHNKATITLKLSGNYKFVTEPGDHGTWACTVKDDGTIGHIDANQFVKLLNDNTNVVYGETYVEDDKIVVTLEKC